MLTSLVAPLLWPGHVRHAVASGPTCLLFSLLECSWFTPQLHSGLCSNIIFLKTATLTNSLSLTNNSFASSYLVFLLCLYHYWYSMSAFAYCLFFQCNAWSKASYILLTTVPLVLRILNHRHSINAVWRKSWIDKCGKCIQRLFLRGMHSIWGMWLLNSAGYDWHTSVNMDCSPWPASLKMQFSTWNYIFKIYKQWHLNAG